MCNIWRERSEKEISPETVSRIFSDKLFKKTKLVKITGGEPTLHSNLPETIRVISELCPDTKIAINTNAYPFERIERVVDECIEVRDDLIFSIGLDGMGETHDYMRGRNCFSEVMKSVNYFEGLRNNKKVLFRFSFTLTPWNYESLPDVVNFAKKKGTYVGFRVMHLDKLYRNEGLKLNSNFMEKVKPILKDFGDNYFKKHIGANKKVNCYAFVNSVFIDPDGKFHACLYRESEGNGSLSRLWKGEEGRKIRNNVKRCSKCWSDCQTVPNIIAEFGAFK
jgi:MoaA/NifB/PqqE/SkfB family radical SAM enzyme